MCHGLWFATRQPAAYMKIWLATVSIAIQSYGFTEVSALAILQGHAITKVRYKCRLKIADVLDTPQCS